MPYNAKTQRRRDPVTGYSGPTSQLEYAERTRDLTVRNEGRELPVLPILACVPKRGILKRNFDASSHRASGEAGYSVPFRAMYTVYTAVYCIYCCILYALLYPVYTAAYCICCCRLYMLLYTTRPVAPVAQR